MSSDPSRPTRLRRARALGDRWLEEAQLARPGWAIGSLLLLCAMIVGASVIPVPYVVERPGPAVDVLGEYEEEQILVISGAETHPTEGELMMTTVSVDGGPGYTVTPVEVIRAWFDRSQAVLPRESVFPEGQTREQTALTNTASMSTSQQGAVAVALDALDIEYEPAVLVAGVEEEGPADGTLEPGDVIVSVGGETAADLEGFRTLIRAADPDGPVAMTVRRDGEELELEVPAEEVDGTARLGIVLSDGYEFPFEVDLAVGDIGGPSAGMIFSLAVYDELTPGALTGGESIAGTGTIAADGAVGAIGGIRQKLVGASDTGADFFLAPAANCQEVVGYEPDGLEVVAVETFDQAVEATETIAETGSTEGLVTCEDVIEK
ncbi:PDZ domain-containing protein [Brachybacterium sp. J144]|uniref:YlbL family protein n=1 Tax=Brachybacterium sp. J144 TaxID=3116487 RepID=UPI002E7657A2|nr:PDZ domain-containing protein [Brachybacterium sp. J144]MEE1649303.1 PDZ domain-containing protein [Brachybacterium sp. J144]